MDIHGASISVKKKLFNIIVECLDNIQKHTDALNSQIALHSRIKQSVDHSFFSFDFNDEYYVIKTKNVIQNEFIDNLKIKVDRINQLDKEGLKKHYEQVILEGEISSKGGAGLGLIDIALKSNNKLEYKFEAIDDQYSFFILQVKVDITN